MFFPRVQTMNNSPFPSKTRVTHFALNNSWKERTEAFYKIKSSD